MMKRVLTIGLLTALLIGLPFGVTDAFGQEVEEPQTDQACPPPSQPSKCPQTCPPPSQPSKCPGGLGNQAFGLSVSFPFANLPANTATSILFVNLFAQGDLTQNVFHRTEVRLPFFAVFGLDPSLISVRESLLYAFTPAPVVFYVGSGASTIPIATNGNSGFQFSLLARLGVEVQVAPLGLFLDLTYGTVPVPWKHVNNGNPATAINNLELSFGAAFHF